MSEKNKASEEHLGSVLIYDFSAHTNSLLAYLSKRVSGYSAHWSDCSTNNIGVSEMLEPCDCGGHG